VKRYIVALLMVAIVALGLVIRGAEDHFYLVETIRIH
jgi:6,7-dimethyl-8-ribityllumazine synthase